MNAIHSEQYRDWQEKCQALFAPEHRFPDMDRTEELADGFSVCFQVWHGEIDGRNLYISENRLFDKDGKVRFTWRNLDGIGFASLVSHTNGQHYLIFNIDLYGYGIWELESGQELRYIPSQAYPEKEKDFEETFIWASADYEPQSNLLAVCGCFWAWPYSTIVLDFSDPLAVHPSESWLDVRNLFDPDCTTYNHVEFAGWEKDTLCLDCDRQDNDQQEKVYLTVKELQDAMGATQSISK